MVSDLIYSTSELPQSIPGKHKINGYEENEHLWDSTCNQITQATKK